MSGPLTILHLTHDGRGAGSSISIALLARTQQAAGHRVMIGCPPGCWLERHAARSGVPTTPVTFESFRDSADTIQHLAATGRVDVVNAHASVDRGVTRRLRLQGRLKSALVVTRRGMPLSSPWSALLTGFAADRTIAVSRAVRRSLVRRGTPPWRITVVPNAVDLERMDREVTPAALEQARGRVDGGRWTVDGKTWRTSLGPVIGVVSRLKDHSVLIAALNHVTTPVTLISVGFAPDPSFPHSVHCPPSTVHRIFWLPFHDNPRPFYDLFDVVVLPTRHEGLSQGLLEAMALGHAVVTTRSGGNADLIDHGVHGLLVPPRDARALGAALQRLLDDAALRERLGQAAQRRARSEFTIECTAAATEAVYREALARR